MEPNLASYYIAPLGDSAILVDFGNKIDEDINKKVIARTRQLKENLANVTEVVPAYSSLIVYFDLVKWKKNLPKDKLVFQHLKETIDDLLSQPLLPDEHSSRLIKIPVCY